MPEFVTGLPVLQARPVDSNKGSFGRVLVIAGSRGMAGAGILCASAALRSGAGLVTLAVPGSIQSTVAAANPCYLTANLPDDDAGRFSSAAEEPLLGLAQQNDVMAIGPGIGRSEQLGRFVVNLLGKTAAPIVLDADGLNAFQGRADSLRNRAAPLILTPHPGEFARLLGTDVATVQAHRQECAVKFAADHRLVLVLKGHQTIVTDGQRIYINTTGNPGMATGGTGDVLTGMIVALLGQELEPFSAAQLGVHLHGLAGDLARDRLGEVSLIASDLIEFLPQAFRNA